MITELDIAKQIRDGELSSPQRFANSLFVALRITGTGAAYRDALDEFVWRDPALYLNPEFLERCNGLPVIFEHPIGRALNSEEFSKRIVGTVMLPYIQDDEVWGIARILDAETAELIEQEPMSTSPAVVFKNSQPTQAVGADDVLIEGPPALVDHCALLLGPGVWDKGKGLHGVASVDARLNKALNLIQDSADTRRRTDKLDEILGLVQRSSDSLLSARLDSVLRQINQIARR